MGINPETHNQTVLHGVFSSNSSPQDSEIYVAEEKES